jgi:hypothetical protein
MESFTFGDVEKVAANKGLRLLALVGVLALVITVGTAPIGASGNPGAAAAKKKKCGKKKPKKQADAAKKKKKCKKKKQNPKPTLVRATITWTNADSADADLDLFVFDASGGVAAKGATTIPNSAISADIVGTNGSETFTDLAPNPLRTLSFGVCYQVGGSAHAPFNISYVTADGQTHTDSKDPGSSFHYDFPGGAPIPAGYCPN